MKSNSSFYLCSVRPDYITSAFLHDFIKNAFAEDVGDGDHSTLASIPKDAQSKAVLKVKDQGILAGVELALEIFAQYDHHQAKAFLL